MNVLIAGHKERGIQCLRRLASSSHGIVGAVAHPPDGTPALSSSFAQAARELRLPVFEPAGASDPAMVAALAKLGPDLVILAGYGPIVKRRFIELAPKGCINLHSGRLPQYRGSSPMNWALLNGEQSFTLSIIHVDRGVDTGDVLVERTFPIGPEDTIVDLHRTANAEFPGMLLGVLDQIERGTVTRRKQDEAGAGYYPLRFPDDGVVFWDQLTALQAHNRIRALTSPYPCAFTFYNGRRVKLLRSRLREKPFYGEPGRIYRITPDGLLVAASDCCLWITAAVFEGTDEPLAGVARRYDTLATIRGVAASIAMEAVSV